MQLIQFDDFNFAQGAIPATAGVVACAIAPSSTVDVCEVNGYRLGPGAVIPCAPGDSLRAVRGWRTGLDPLSGTEAMPRLDGALVLQLYGAGDVLSHPGPLAPLMRSAIVPAYVAVRGFATLALRIPCSGRDQIAIAIKRSSGAVANLSYMIRAHRYFTRDQLQAMTPAQRLAEHSYLEESEGSLFDGGASIPLSAMTPPGPATSPELGQVIYVGGFGDLAEAFDEIEVRVWGAAAGNVFVSAESRSRR